MPTLISPKFELMKDRVFISLSCLSLVLFLYILCLPLNHDAAWLFQTSFMWLEGQEFGYDIVDPNPPMMMWLTVPPALLVDFFFVPAELTLKLYFYMLVYIVFIYLYKHLNLTLEVKKTQLVQTGIAYFIFFIFMPGYNFGQREHIAAALILPYLLNAASIENKKSFILQIFAGIFGAIALAFKPHFLIVIILVETLFLLKNKKMSNLFRLDTLTLCISLLFYMLVIYLTSPKYLTEVLPTMFWVYSYYEEPTLPIYHISIFTLFALLSSVQIYRTKKNRQLPSVLFIAALGFATVAFYQNKGWDYHWLPAHILIMLSLVLSIDNFKQLSTLKSITISLIAIQTTLLSSFIPWVTQDVKQSFSPKNTSVRVHKMAERIKTYNDGDIHVFAFATSPRDVNPAILKSKARCPAGVCTLSYSPVAMKAGNELSLSRRDFLIQEDRNLISKLKLNTPQVIFVQTHGRLALSDSDTSFLDHFHQYSEFKQFWADYSKIDRIGNYDVYIKEKE